MKKQKNEALVPEVMPKTETTCELERPDITRAKKMQDAVEHHAVAFAYARIAYGVALLEIKRRIPHGSWKQWYETNLERPGFAYRTCQLYTKVAKAFKAKAQSFALLDSASPDEMDADQREQFRAAVADVTTAGTWQQLEMDLGLARPPKATGGARDKKQKTIAPGQLKADAAAVWGDRLDWMMADLRKPRPSYLLLDRAALDDAVDRLSVVLAAIKEARK